MGTGTSPLGGGSAGAVTSHFDNLTTGTAKVKYSAMEMLAKGNPAGKPTGHAYDSVISKLGMTDNEESRSLIQKQAQKWLKNNPKPSNPKKDGYTWNGQKYVKS